MGVECGHRHAPDRAVHDVRLKGFALCVVRQARRGEVGGDQQIVGLDLAQILSGPQDSGDVVILGQRRRRVPRGREDRVQRAAHINAEVSAHLLDCRDAGLWTCPIGDREEAFDAVFTCPDVGIRLIGNAVAQNGQMAGVAIA